MPDSPVSAFKPERGNGQITAMRLPSNESEDNPEDLEAELPMEVKIWVQKGWTVTPSHRKGIVITKPKAMLMRTKIALALGTVGVIFTFAGVLWLELGASLLLLGFLDYRVLTKVPTKFFPGEGEKQRMLER
jgi:hypothetical protein